MTTSNQASINTINATNPTSTTTPPNTAGRSAWQVVQLARHDNRPLFLDYASGLFEEVDFLAGDRLFGEDKALLGGLARFDGRPVVIIGQHKGSTTRDRLKHNFGMPNPEGYRKAKRLAQLAERFGLPIITFIDTPGAYPGKEAEERGQSEAIAQCLLVFSHIKVPVINVVIGEGGSGGALAIGVGDHLIMLSNSIYSVISPEGCASILWKTNAKAEQASEALGLTAERLYALGLIDEIIDEQQGAHLNPEQVMQALRNSLNQQLDRLSLLSAEDRCQNRYQKLMSYDSTGLSMR